jgi:aminodeoxyfutalosine deaminase
MKFRKITAPKIFDGTKFLPDNSVLILTESGTIKEIVDLSIAADDVEAVEGIIVPGFVNTHCHLELSNLKATIPEHCGMADFLRSVINKRSSGRLEEAMHEADSEMHRNGIVAVGDICNTSVSAGLKSESLIYYHNFIEVLGMDAAVADQRFASAQILAEAFARNVADGTRSRCSIVPHSAYSVSDRLLNIIAGCSHGNIVSIHNQESRDEDAFIRTGDGPFLELFHSLSISTSHVRARYMSPLQYMLPVFHPARQMILVHNVTTDLHDIEFAASLLPHPEMFWCLCPNANVYITGDLPDVPLLKSMNQTIVLGTDSLASNHQLDMLSEMRTILNNFPSLSFTEVLEWATVNGAKALGIEGNYGSIDVNKKPGFVAISNTDGERLNNDSVARRIL